MSTTHPLTLTVEQAAQVLGIGRSTAYELVRSGDLKCIHLRRRIVIPVAHLADRLGVSHAHVRDAAQGSRSSSLDLLPGPRRPLARVSCDARQAEQPALF